MTKPAAPVNTIMHQLITKLGEEEFSLPAEQGELWAIVENSEVYACLYHIKAGLAYKALKDDAEKEEDDDEDPPCVDNLDAKKDGKYKKKFCDKKKAQGKCDSKPRFMKKVCSKTCGFCTAAEGEEGEEEAKEPVAPPACENTPGKKKRKRGLEVWCENKAAKNQGKVSACPATAPSSPPPLLRPPAISRGGSHAPPPPRAPRPRSARRRRSAKSAARRARRSPTRGAPTAR